MIRSTNILSYLPDVTYQRQKNGIARSRYLRANQKGKISSILIISAAISSAIALSSFNSLILVVCGKPQFIEEICKGRTEILCAEDFCSFAPI